MEYYPIFGRTNCRTQDSNQYMSKYGIHIFFFAIILSIVHFMSSCQDDSVSDNPDIMLDFSMDTLSFDTVFTERGSATRSFKVFNLEDKAVIIDRISLQDPDGFFRLNIDGFAQNDIENIRVEANDSIYIFVELTIDPDNPVSISPFFIERHIKISAGVNTYDVMLEAWGQNANYIPNRESAGRVSYVSCQFGDWVWDDPKPYVLYGVLVIDSCDLVLPPGTEVYVHGGVAINELGVFNDGLFVFLQNGHLISQGTVDEPVLFKTDRLENEFDEVQGQWSGILLSKNTKGNNLSHTRIENSIVGLSVDSAASVRIESSVFAFTGGSGISASHASIYAENCLFYQNAGAGISLNFGGSYSFNYCTVANYDNQDVAVEANNIKCFTGDCSSFLINALDCGFSNCIFTGNDRDELSLFDATDGSNPSIFKYNFDHCIVRVDELLNADAFPNFFDNCSNCKNTVPSDTLFRNVDAYNFELDTMSIAIDAGKDLPFIDTDILGQIRESGKVDIGCYEFQK